jgi:hypothetical protein
MRIVKSRFVRGKDQEVCENVWRRVCLNVVAVSEVAFDE